MDSCLPVSWHWRPTSRAEHCSAAIRRLLSVTRMPMVSGQPTAEVPQVRTDLSPAVNEAKEHKGPRNGGSFSHLAAPARDHSLLLHFQLTATGSRVTVVIPAFLGSDFRACRLLPCSN